MANTHETLTSLFTDIADAIRSKTGSEESIKADDFPSAIEEIGGVGTILTYETWIFELEDGSTVEKNVGVSS